MQRPESNWIVFSVSGCPGDRLAAVPVVSPASSSRLPTPPASPSLVPLFLVNPCLPVFPCYSFVRPAPAALSHVRFVMVRMSVLGDALKTLSNAEKRGKRQVMLRPSSKVVIKFLQIMQKHGTLAAHCRDLGTLFSAEWAAAFGQRASCPCGLRSLTFGAAVGRVPTTQPLT